MNYRKGRLTSSSAHIVAKGGASLKTYIEQKVNEILTDRDFSKNVGTRPIIWGRVMEHVAVQILSNSFYKDLTHESNGYKIHSNDTVAGATDIKINSEDAIGEIKCYGIVNFSKYAKCLMQQDVNQLKKEFAQEYWQLVHNSILYEKNNAIAIAFMPFLHELLQVREMIVDTDFIDNIGVKLWEARFIFEEDINELDWLPIGSSINNIVTFKFTVPDEDKIKLTNAWETVSNEIKANVYNINKLIKA